MMRAESVLFVFIMCAMLGLGFLGAFRTERVLRLWVRCEWWIQYAGTLGQPHLMSRAWQEYFERAFKNPAHSEERVFMFKLLGSMAMFLGGFGLLLFIVTLE